MSKALWACSLCGEDFTRRSSAERHRNNLHQGRSNLGCCQLNLMLLTQRE